MQNGNNQLFLCPESGSIISYQISGKEFCAPQGEKRSLFTIKLLDEMGTPEYVTSTDAKEFSMEEQGDGCRLYYKKIGKSRLTCIVTIRPYGDNGFAWNLSVQNNSTKVMEWVEFPQLTLVNDMKYKGGLSKIFWPALEGVEVEDATLRSRNPEHMNYKEITGQTAGYCGFYPGSSPMQFMAYYEERAGLYFGAHDAACAPKTLEYYERDEGIAFEMRNFCNGAEAQFELGFDIVTCSFKGDWHDAAEIYRLWMEKHTALPKKIADHSKLPDWLLDSPLIALYPVRGTKDTGDMSPNFYYPYKNVLPVTDELSQKTDSRIMALLMHWEGTAPWATPYVWPPFGGEGQFKEFVNEVHQQGNLVGVYCSGIGWTTKSFLDPSLDFSDRYDETLMCRTPQGMIEQSKVIGDPIRLGYDMCPFQDKVSEIVSEEVKAIAKSGCDYAQYFDQNLGGESSFCYARNHGHPATPGVWQNEAMIRIFQKVYQELETIDSQLVIGCEGAASEPFIKYLPFNDLRYQVGFFFGKPVPAYAYLFHEYVNNFMGNQNMIDRAFDLKKNPDCLLFRIAYSFAAGDLLTVTLADQGKIHWGWDVPWDAELPDQESTLAFIRHLNLWRRKYGDFLQTGKMMKPHQLQDVGNIKFYLAWGDVLEMPSLLTSRWKNKNGQEGQMIVNYLSYEQTCQIDCHQIYDCTDAEGKAYTGKVTIPPHCAVWVS